MAGPLAITLRNREHGPMEDEIKAEGQRFLSEFASADPAQRDALRQKGQSLARRIRSAAIGLGMSKATEFSPDSQVLFLLAAKIAWLSFGADAPELQPFERDVYYYANFSPPDPIVTAYDEFKRTAS